jgi:hypothetical protein
MSSLYSANSAQAITMIAMQVIDDTAPYALGRAASDGRDASRRARSGVIGGLAVESSAQILGFRDRVVGLPERTEREPCSGQGGQVSDQHKQVTNTHASTLCQADGFFFSCPPRGLGLRDGRGRLV